MADPTGAEGVDFADAMARYWRSHREVSRLRINPHKVIPFAQYPEEVQLGHGIITRGKNVKEYVRYVLRVAADNEQTAEQARPWWAWWEKAQVDPHAAGPAPLVSPNIEDVLQMAARRRKADTAEQPPPATLELTDLVAVEAKSATTPAGPGVTSTSPFQHQAGVVNGGDRSLLRLPQLGPLDRGKESIAKNAEMERLAEQAEFIRHQQERPFKMLSQILDRLPAPRAEVAPNDPEIPKSTGKGKNGGRSRKKAKKQLSDKAILVLRVLPSSTEPALKTLGAIARKVAVTPSPSESSMWRAVQELRTWTPPLADANSYRRTRAGDHHSSR